MKLRTIIFLCLIFSILFIVIALYLNFRPIYAEQLEVLRLSKLQHVCMKTYKRQRKAYVPMRSVLLAQKSMDVLLLKNPILFDVNNFTSLNGKKEVLTKIVDIVNHVKEDVALSITAYTDNLGDAQHNLVLSQKRADRLKSYFLKRTNIVLVSAIGYGESLPQTSRRIELNLQKITK